MVPDTDFEAIEGQITLHGLGFLQMKLPANRRLHIWHPDLPRRKCFQWSAIHNHRFSFRSTVLVGTQVNRRYNVIESSIEHPTTTHNRIFHNGPRGYWGGRVSYANGHAQVAPLPDEHYTVGESYEMPVMQYHETPNSGIVVTLMEKMLEGTTHASTLIEVGHDFDQEFNRFQLTKQDMWRIIQEALESVDV